MAAILEIGGHIEMICILIQYLYCQLYLIYAQNVTNILNYILAAYCDLSQNYCTTAFDVHLGNFPSY